MQTRGTALGITMLIGGLVASSASAQSGAGSLWHTQPGGDASGDRISVELGQREGALHGTRRVERIDAPSGYTTGTLATVVLAGSEPEDRRSIRVHLPYGASLDLAAGDVVDVDATSRRLGLGTAQEVRITRHGELILLTTSRDRVGDIRVARDAELPREGSRRRWALRVTVGRTQVRVAQGELVHLRDRSLLVQGHDIAYEGVRPPDAFDSRTVTVVRIRPLATPAP